MPDWEDDLLSVEPLSDESVEFIIRPALTKEMLGENHDPESAPGKSVVDLSPQAIPDSQLKLVVPNDETSRL